MALLLTAWLIASLTACGDGDGDRELTVLAAASLTETFTELAELYEAEHPGVDVLLSFGSSTTLAQQAADGAPGDVLATADEPSMDLARDTIEGQSHAFAVNSLVLVTPRDNPAGIRSVRDLTGADVDYVACAPTAPCGALAAAVIEAADLPAPASQEVDVRAVLARVADDEADAGFVYATDAVAAGADVRPIAITSQARLTTTYPIAVLAQTREPEEARAFVELVLSTRGREVLSSAGFGSP